MIIFVFQVERSVALIKSLSSERTRWEAGSETFKSQMATIIGDCILSSAFMAYAGYFDQSLRLSLVSSWATHLKAAGIQFRSDLARVEVNYTLSFSICNIFYGYLLSCCKKLTNLGAIGIIHQLCILVSLDSG